MKISPCAELAKRMELGDANMSSVEQVRGGRAGEIENRDVTSRKTSETGQRRNVGTAEALARGFNFR